jgi:hypothetical protein
MVRRWGRRIGVAYVLLGALAFITSLFTDFIPQLSEWALQHQFTAANFIVLVSAGLVTLWFTNPPETNYVASLASTAGYKVSAKERTLLDEDAWIRGKIVLTLIPVYVVLSLIVIYLLPQPELVREDTAPIWLFAGRVPLKMVSFSMALIHTVVIMCLLLLVGYVTASRNFPALKPLKSALAQGLLLDRELEKEKEVESEKVSKVPPSERYQLVRYTLWAFAPSSLVLKWDQLKESKRDYTRMEIEAYIRGFRCLVASASLLGVPALIALAIPAFLAMRPINTSPVTEGISMLIALFLTVIILLSLFWFALFMTSLRRLPTYCKDLKQETMRDRRLKIPVSKTLQSGFLQTFGIEVHGWILLVVCTLLQVGIVAPQSFFIISLVSGSAIVSLSLVALFLQRRYASRLLSHLPEEEKTRT